MPDTLQNGRFVLLGTIGEGAQGRTFDGVDKREGRAVAIKRFDVRGATTWKDVEMAEREARVLQSLSHPRLPRYIDHFEQDGALYLVMEKIEGESLARLRKRGVVFGEDDVVRLLRDASEVLEYLHGRAPPVIHRDLKPGNVIRRPDGSFAFVDFGAVREKLRPEGGSTVVGTFGYMGPEQFQGRALAGSDVYAIGATAVSLLTGREPEDLPHKGLALDVRAALRGRAGAGLIGVLEKMLDPDPDRRASRIAPLLARLERGAERGRSAGPSHRANANWRELAGRQLGRDVRRYAKRLAREERRRAERAARRYRRRNRVLPWPLALLFTLMFTLGIVAVAIVTQAVVPMVLRILSLFFAHRALSSAADAVRDAGSVALREMDRSRRWFRGQGGGPNSGAAESIGSSTAEETYVRVAPSAGARVSVDEEDEDAAEQEAQAERADEERKR